MENSLTGPIPTTVGQLTSLGKLSQVLANFFCYNSSWYECMQLSLIKNHLMLLVLSVTFSAFLNNLQDQLPTEIGQMTSLGTLINSPQRNMSYSLAKYMMFIQHSDNSIYFIS